jgi:hypothetical protein
VAVWCKSKRYIFKILRKDLKSYSARKQLKMNKRNSEFYIISCNMGFDPWVSRLPPRSHKAEGWGGGWGKPTTARPASSISREYSSYEVSTPVPTHHHEENLVLVAGRASETSNLVDSFKNSMVAQNLLHEHCTATDHPTRNIHRHQTRARDIAYRYSRIDLEWCDLPSYTFSVCVSFPHPPFL